MKINNIVYTKDVEKLPLISEYHELGIKCISATDARSALYMATGIAAQKEESVLVVVNSSNSSRSTYSGLTEAYYRKLPIVLLTLGQMLNYQNELKDVINSHYVIDDITKLDDLSIKKYPAHIELKSVKTNIEKIGCMQLQLLLSNVLDTDDYLYFAQGVKKEASISYKCKIVNGGTKECYEGAVANVLGASLAKKHNRYICLLTETEFIHDLNTLGNINMNDRILLIVLVRDNEEMLKNIGIDLRFKVNSKANINENTLKNAIESRQKEILLIRI